MSSDDPIVKAPSRVGFDPEPGVLSDEAERDFRVDPTMPAGESGTIGGLNPRADRGQDDGAQSYRSQPRQLGKWVGNRSGVIMW